MLKPRLASQETMSSPTTIITDRAGSSAPQPPPWALVRKVADCLQKQSSSEVKGCFADVKSTFHGHCSHGGATEGLGGNILLSETAADNLPSRFSDDSRSNNQSSPEFFLLWLFFILLVLMTGRLAPHSSPLVTDTVKTKGAMLTEEKQKPNTRDFLEGLVIKGPNGLFKINNKMWRLFRTDICVLPQCTVEKFVSIFKYWELVHLNKWRLKNNNNTPHTPPTKKNSCPLCNFTKWTAFHYTMFSWVWITLSRNNCGMSHTIEILV